MLGYKTGLRGNKLAETLRVERQEAGHSTKRANKPNRKVFNMKAKHCFVALLLPLISVMPSYGITLIDGEAMQNITTTGTSWVAHARTEDNQASVLQVSKEMILSGGGEMLYADNIFTADSIMHLDITYYGGALNWTLNGVSLGAVRPTVEFNAIGFRLWTDGAGYTGSGWELNNLSINGEAVVGSWNARAISEQSVQTLFFCTLTENLSQISADLKLYSPLGMGVPPGSDMAQFTISGLSIIPEPSSVLLSVIGLGALLLAKISYRKR
jgi:hypothetical protein